MFFLFVLLSVFSGVLGTAHPSVSISPQALKLPDSPPSSLHPRATVPESVFCLGEKSPIGEYYHAERGEIVPHIESFCRGDMQIIKTKPLEAVHDISLVYVYTGLYKRVLEKRELNGKLTLRASLYQCDWKTQQTSSEQECKVAMMAALDNCNTYTTKKRGGFAVIANCMKFEIILDEKEGSTIPDLPLEEITCHKKSKEYGMPTDPSRFDTTSYSYRDTVCGGNGMIVGPEYGRGEAGWLHISKQPTDPQKPKGDNFMAKVVLRTFPEEFISNGTSKCQNVPLKITRDDCRKVFREMFNYYRRSWKGTNFGVAVGWDKCFQYSFYACKGPKKQPDAQVYQDRNYPIAHHMSGDKGGAAVAIYNPHQVYGCI